MRQKQSRLSSDVERFQNLNERIDDFVGLVDLAESDESMLVELILEGEVLKKDLEALELQSLFSHPESDRGCFLDIQAGSGGTEAQDWASMLRRMYLRYCENQGLSAELIEESLGEVAGIKNSTIKVESGADSGAYGHLRTETGIHRLVRKSPFDSNHRRHTSFASVFVYPVVDDTVEIDINPSDLRIDTYRSSGAGGQHVNTTDSAVRITHEPTGIVVQCQSDRSQHKNRTKAMSVLRARLYNHMMEEKNVEKRRLEESKSDISWGNQIRSYVLDQSRIKDLRTGHENGNPQAVLDGDLRPFIEASLRQGL